MKDTTDLENKPGIINLLALVLSVYVLLALIIDTIFTLSSEIGD